MTTSPLKQPSARRAASDQPEQSESDAAIAQIRKVVIDSLELLGVPSPLKLVADILAVQGHRVTLRQLARLRHIEQREHRTASPAGEPFVVPALSTLDLSALSGSLALSTWPPEQRLVGGRSPRVHHLRVLRGLLELDTPGELRAAMIARHAETIPGAVVRGESRDPQRMRSAAERELEALASLDEDERRSAAAHLESLPLVYQLWGRLTLLDPGLDTPATTAEDQP